MKMLYNQYVNPNNKNNKFSESKQDICKFGSNDKISWNMTNFWLTNEKS